MNLSSIVNLRGIPKLDLRHTVNSRCNQVGYTELSGYIEVVLVRL